METLTDLIRSIPGAAEMSDLAMHITISAIMATLMFIVMALCALIFTWMER